MTQQTDHEYLTDVVMKRLRTRDGLDLQWVQQRFGSDVVTGIRKGAELGLELGLAELANNGSLLRLVDPEGFLYSNYIISSIFVELEAFGGVDVEDNV